MNKILIFIFSILSLMNVISCKPTKRSLPETFLALLNDYKKDSLKIITGENFELEEKYERHIYDKAEFLDSFLTFSKVINGKFNVLKIISKTEPMVFLVEDVSDYSKYLNLQLLTWEITVSTKGGKIERMVSDTIKGYKKYLDDFILKHDSFEKWLASKYPNETSGILFHSAGGLFAERLKEYSTSGVK